LVTVSRDVTDFIAIITNNASIGSSPTFGEVKSQKGYSGRVSCTKTLIDLIEDNESESFLSC